MHNRKFIAYLDILGFKDLVYNNTHERLYELYDKILGNAIPLALAGGKMIIVEKGDKKVWEPDSSQIHINSLIISDSIILWTDDNGMKSFIDIAVIIKALFISLFKIGVPLRGSLVEGNLDKINKTFASKKDNTQITLIGLGLVEAYIKEGEQTWSGCVVDENCIKLYNSYVEQYKSIPDIATIDTLVREELLLKYQPPYKSGKIREDYVIDWAKFKDKKVTELEVRKKFSDYKKTTDDWKVENIIRNTVAYVNDSTNTSK